MSMEQENTLLQQIPNNQPAESEEVVASESLETSDLDINNRPCRELLLPITRSKVYMATYLTAGEDEDATSELMKGVVVKKDNDGVPHENTLAYNRKQLEVGVKRIILKDGSEVAYSENWYSNLPKPDLNVLRQFMLDNYRDIDDEDEEEKKTESQEMNA